MQCWGFGCTYICPERVLSAHALADVDNKPDLSNKGEQASFGPTCQSLYAQVVQYCHGCCVWSQGSNLSSGLSNRTRCRNHTNQCAGQSCAFVAVIQLHREWTSEWQAVYVGILVSGRAGAAGQARHVAKT